MAATESEMLELGTFAPEFSLPDGNKNYHKLGNNGLAYLVMFICNHCPFVIHVREQLSKLGRDYLPKEVVIIAINSNDVENYPADSPDKMKQEAKNNNYLFPYVFDEDQSIAKKFKAACTPDFFIFNKEKKLAYRGRLDSSNPSNDEPVNGNEIRMALDLILANKEINFKQKPSIGCNIKWKPGNEPDYFF